MAGCEGRSSLQPLEHIIDSLASPTDAGGRSSASLPGREAIALRRSGAALGPCCPQVTRPVDGPRRGGRPGLCILILEYIAVALPVRFAHRLISASRPPEMTSRVSTRPALRIRARIISLPSAGKTAPYFRKSCY